MIDMETGDVHLDKGLVIKCCMSKKEFVETFYDELLENNKAGAVERTLFTLKPRALEGVPLVIGLRFDRDMLSTVEIFHEDELHFFEKDKRTVSDQKMYELLYAIARRDFSRGSRILSWGQCEFGRDRDGSSSIVVNYYLRQKRRKS